MTLKSLISNDLPMAGRASQVLTSESIADPSMETLTPSEKTRDANEESQSFPSSKSNALDATLRKIKALCVAGATASSNQAQVDIRSATSSYKNAIGQHGAEDVFRQRMIRIKGQFQNSIDKDIDNVVDEIENLASGLSQSELNVLVNFVDDVVRKGFMKVLSVICDFMIYAVQHLSDWIGEAFEAISKTFSQNDAYIKSEFA